LENSNTLINKWLKEYDVDIFGVGDMTLYDRELIGIDNCLKNRLPYAVFFGLVVSDGILDTVMDGPNPLYLHHYRQLNYRLDMIGYLLSRSIEKKGYRAMPFAASQVIDWQNQKGHISHKHIGALSGVGWIGRNNLLVHPVFGSRGRYNTVLTDMPLTPGVPLKKDCGECTACMDKCPAGAIKPLQSDFDHRGCYEMLTHFKNKRNLGHHICGVCIEACRGQG